MGIYSSKVKTSNTELTNKHFYGWKKDKVDKNDEYHNFLVENKLYNIKLVDLRHQCPAVYDQGHLGSCTANAIAGAYHYDEIKQSEPQVFTPSRLFIYYNERKIEGTIDTDSGAEIRDGIKSINDVGVCSEDVWPYDITKFTVCPSDICYTNAKTHHSVEYKRVEQTLDQLKQCLVEGYPFVFGFEVYSSFESPEVASSGNMPIPKDGEELLGGHAVCAVGFDDNKQVFIVRNSWGEIWGDKGYFYMPYAYITNVNKCSDFWTVRRVMDTNVTFDYSSLNVSN
jgi:C1A family cysteine protease